jgi:hypothetical protein
MRTLKSRERNIRRIGSLQSPFSNAGEVAVVVLIVGDGLLRLGDREVGDNRGSSKHHMGVSWMVAPTMLSPSSFPQTSDKMSEGEKKEKKR